VTFLNPGRGDGANTGLARRSRGPVRSGGWTKETLGLGRREVMAHPTNLRPERKVSRSYGLLAGRSLPRRARSAGTPAGQVDLLSPSYRTATGSTARARSPRSAGAPARPLRYRPNSHGERRQRDDHDERRSKARGQRERGSHHELDGWLTVGRLSALEAIAVCARRKRSMSRVPARAGGAPLPSRRDLRGTRSGGVAVTGTSVLSLSFVQARSIRLPPASKRTTARTPRPWAGNGRPKEAAMQEIDRKSESMGRCVAPAGRALRFINESHGPITTYEGPYEGEADA
jgi:hypothetical protein